MDFKNFIDWKSFIMGAAFASFICVVASQYQLDWLYAFAAIGLLYVGYKAKNMKWGAILGAIAATPLFVLAAYGVFGPLSDSSVNPQVTMLITLIVVLIVGALVGFVGAYTYRNRQRAIAAKILQINGREIIIVGAQSIAFIHNNKRITKCVCCTPCSAWAI